MRLGILSDIHANYEALSAVLEAYASEKIDEYFSSRLDPKKKDKPQRQPSYGQP